MERDTENILILTTHVLNFATRHPYAATGIFGAAVGSAVTYQALKFKEQRAFVNNIFTPKMYKLEIPLDDLNMLVNDPSAELHWETPEITVTITSEKYEPLKQLPIIDYQGET